MNLNSLLSHVLEIEMNWGQTPNRLLLTASQQRSMVCA
jgi:hypothetical protein